MTSLASHFTAWVSNALPLSGRHSGALGGRRREVPRNFFSRRVAVRRSEAGAGRRRPLQVRALFGFRWPGSGESSSRRSRRSGRDSSGGSGGRGGGSGLSNPYRALGVTENASYEQIEAAYEALRIKYADDAKQLTKLEILKDRIFDDQLRRRLEGTMEGIVKESPLEKRLREEPRWKSTWFGRTILTILETFQGIVQKPDRSYLTKTSALFGFLALLALFIPRFATSVLPLAFLASLGFLYNRGTPDVRRDEFGQVGEVRPAKPKEVLKSVCIVFVMGGLGFALGRGFISLLGIEEAAASGLLPAWVHPNGIVSLFINVGMWIASTFFIVQKSV